MSAAPRSRAQRRRDTEHRLTHDKDVGAASASADGAPYPVPLSFDRDGGAPTGRAAWPGPGGPTGRSEGEPDVLLEAGRIEPGNADGDREGGPA
ncbi:hypothetical protein GCM10022205_06480 [Spinactinospora alkalitolerans]